MKSKCCSKSKTLTRITSIVAILVYLKNIGEDNYGWNEFSWSSKRTGWSKDTS